MPEWLNTGSLIGAIAGSVIIPTVWFLWARLLTRERTVKMGVKIGVFLSAFFRQNLGEHGENKTETTAIDLMDGIKIGLRKDNA